ncbi:MAG: glycosyltransferase family 4 protein [Pseudomonadota bacterium]
MKLLFVSGPGDVAGSYRAWKAGQDDARVPVRTYTNMFLDAAAARQAEVMLIHGHKDREELDDGPVHIRSMFHGGKRGLLAFSWDKFQAARRFAAMINDFDPDFAILSSAVPLLVPRFLNRRIAVHYTMHNTFWAMNVPPPPGLKTLVRRVFRRFTISAFHGAICTSEECRRQLLPHIGSNKPVLVERPVLSSQVALSERVQPPRRLVYVGRIEPSKGVFLLLDAFERLAARIEGLSLVYIGDGGALAELRARVAASPQSERIEVRGRLLAKDVHVELARSDLLVCPTMTAFMEGLALVGLEAAAHGVPSLVSSAVPAQDLLGPACRVFPADDGAALERVLAEILEDPDLYASLVEGAEGLAGLLSDGSESWGVQLERLLDRALPRDSR